MRLTPALLTLAILLLASACSPARRLARLCERHPEICAADTVVVGRDTVIAASERDTNIYFFQPAPVVLRKNNLVLSYKFNSVDSTVDISGRCDTVRIPGRDRIITRTFQAVKTPKWVWPVLLTLAATLLTILIFLIFSRKTKQT